MMKINEVQGSSSPTLLYFSDDFSVRDPSIPPITLEILIRRITATPYS